ncbi:SPOR domain-containing protein [Sphingosinicella rhizophila]|uniref:SPOR domain-containing protein n=1 Tax=Sphingosinicella rhizophila TaxID=3050082 RepID=A0ABU3Q321_9SPHN|nr:SPOR domain-containing protein [Sphingosinicella sp. GR2756]MDT9597802.1 SPOR domain-containing protein [Sphingosinicella sp. GR2756]
MMNKATMKFAASSLIIGVTMVGCSATPERPGALAASTAKAEQQAGQYHSRARLAAQRGLMGQALVLAEHAVELSPRDVAYRMLLGDLYLKNGRFQSAATSFADVLALDPGNDRAGLSRALALVGRGDRDGALAQLETVSSSIGAGDLGLAYALAGQPQRAVAMLEAAARAPGADGRTRQNLALAYAFAGDWQKARVTAAQDVSPAMLDERLLQWAALASPTSSANQMAILLGITPSADPGQPVRLALAPTRQESNALAALEASAAAEADAAPLEMSAPEPVQIAAVETVEPVSLPETIGAEPKVETVDYVAAVEALVAPEPALLRTASADIATTVPTFSSPRLQPVRQKPVRTSSGGFVVQIGAYSSAENVERAWAQAYRRYGFSDYQPLSTKIGIPGKGTFHRLSVAGFETRADAARICSTIKAKGGACFVRTVAGDAPVRWASRYSSPRA